MARRRFIDLTFEHGLLESQEPSVVPPGFTTIQENWISEPGGGLRARRGWLKGSTTGAPATRKCVGAGYFTRLITPGIVQSSDIASASDAGTMGTILTPTWKQTTGRGHLLILVAALETSDGTTTAPAPAGWTQAVVSADTAGRPRIVILYKANAAPESGSVSVQWAGSAGATVQVAAQLIEVAGVTVTSPVDVTASTNAAADATPDSGTTAATSQVVEFVISSLVDESLDTAFTALTNGFQQLAATNVGTQMLFGTFFKITTATGTQSLTATTSTADDCAGVIVAFKGWFSGAPAAGQTSVARFLAVQNDTTEYDIFAIDRDALAAGTWAAVGSIVTADPSQLVAEAPGLGRAWFTNTQWATPYVYDGEGLSAITGGPAGRSVAVHKNRVFIAGTTGQPGRLFFSDINDGGNWPAPNFIDIGGAEDGEPIEDIAPFENGLLIAKRTALYFLSGDGPDTFTLDRLNGGGAAPGRCITPTPFGAVIAGKRDVWIWAGGGVQKVSRPIENSYRGEGSWVSCSIIDESAYILCPDQERIYVLHLPTGTWRTETIDAQGDGPAVLYNQDFTQLLGPASSTVASLLNYREFPGTARAKDFDSYVERFIAETDELWASGPSTVFMPLNLHLQLRQRGGTSAQTPLSVTPTYDGVAKTAITLTPKDVAGTFRARVDLGSPTELSSAKWRFSQTLASGEAAVFDIERCVLELEEAELA